MEESSPFVKMIVMGCYDCDKLFVLLKQTTLCGGKWMMAYLFYFAANKCQIMEI